jgi:hypothetical protein
VACKLMKCFKMATNQLIESASSYNMVYLGSRVFFFFILIFFLPHLVAEQEAPIVIYEDKTLLISTRSHLIISATCIRCGFCSIETTAVSGCYKMDILR